MVIPAIPLTTPPAITPTFELFEVDCAVEDSVAVVDVAVKEAVNIIDQFLSARVVSFANYSLLVLFVSSLPPRLKRCRTFCFALLSLRGFLLHRT